eukprot:4843535-Pyramimonas_sp.AAC.1
MTCTPCLERRGAEYRRLARMDSSHDDGRGSLVVVVVLVDRLVGVDVGLAVGLEDVELSGWPRSLE